MSIYIFGSEWLGSHCIFSLNLLTLRWTVQQLDTDINLHSATNLKGPLGRDNKKLWAKGTTDRGSRPTGRGRQARRPSSACFSIFRITGVTWAQNSPGKWWAYVQTPFSEICGEPMFISRSMLCVSPCPTSCQRQSQLMYLFLQGFQTRLYQGSQRRKECRQALIKFTYWIQLHVSVSILLLFYSPLLSPLKYLSKIFKGRKANRSQISIVCPL